MRMRLSFAVLILLALIFAPLTTRAADNYKVDSVHAAVIFKVAHAGVGNAYGRFNEPTGTVVLDKSDPSKSSFTFEVDVNKIDTANEKRDQHLKSPDFFDAKQFPTITFKSTKITKSTEGEYEVASDLTVHGVTKPITVTVKKVGEATTQMGHRAGWDPSCTVKRSDFGMNFMPGGIGDEVTLNVAIEGIRQ